MTRPLLFPAIIALGLATQPALALESDRNQPINISADALNIDESAGTAVYTGTVEVDQGSMQLRSQRVELERGENGGLSRLTARDGDDGRAYVEQKPSPEEPLARGWGETIIYHAGERRVELIGNAELHQSGDTFNGGYVEYFLDTRQINARGSRSAESQEDDGGRVRMQLTPDNQQGSSTQ